MINPRSSSKRSAGLLPSGEQVKELIDSLSYNQNCGDSDRAIFRKLRNHPVITRGSPKRAPNADFSGITPPWTFSTTATFGRS
ncbi:MAG: hypothetical protein ACTIC1_04840 [Brevibacterium sp.]